MITTAGESLGYVEGIVARRGIETRLLHNLIEVRAEEQLAVFEVRAEGQDPSIEEIHFELLHVVPPMAAPDVVATSPLAGHYDGYTTCPLITGFHSVVMAEFNDDLQQVSSFLVDPTKERWSRFLVETRLFPWVYWNRVLKGPSA